VEDDGSEHRRGVRLSRLRFGPFPPPRGPRDAAGDQVRPRVRPREGAEPPGLVATREDERALLDALEKAFDYRGDCTITTAGGDAVTGYIFDRRRGETLDASTLRLMTPDSDEHVTVRFSEIARLEFTGRDTAHGSRSRRG
jgi:hypothetical protein